MKGHTPLLITIDMHCYPDIEKEFTILLEDTLRVFNELSIKATFFFPSNVAEKFPGHVRMILNRGHEIGCHGLNHHPVDEQYNIMPYEKQKSTLNEAKKRLEQITATEVISFRAPVFKVNGNTMRALEENGFKADLSVTPQRFGLLSSELGNFGWLYSPRVPYHPSFTNPFRRGASSLWEIPQSCFILPFMSTVGIAFGERFMRLFFKFLYTEASLKKNPIVYMGHIEEIYPREMKYTYKFKWKHLLPTKARGFRLRYILFKNKDGKEISRETLNLLKMMKNHRNIETTTVKNVVEALKASCRFY